ncbi:uncharacterized protein LOC131677675 [Topomyia yanbarensis]|uniref:uncharacterized protein LOC131677675 n=1 Tax=Topomyia yanbarensis TaxID=2498891 RepID=UPI00273C62E5|nr:uncharacterized protein LOC131677675 [Topomyia yanbarensis]
METAMENVRKYAAGGQEDNFCRLCFVKAFKLRSVFPYGDDPDNDLFRKIANLALVRLNHVEEPDCCICSRCVANLEEFAKFRRQCEILNNQLLDARGQSETKLFCDSINVISVPPVHVDAQPLNFSNEQPEYQDTIKHDVDPFEEHAPSDVDMDHEDRPKTRSSARKSLSAGKKRGRKRLKRPLKVEDTESSDDQFEDAAFDSEDSFKPTRSRGRPRRFKDFVSTVKKKKKQGRKSRTEQLEEEALSSDEDETTNSKKGSSCDFKVYNAGHGTINIAFQGYRYVKFRYCKTGASTRHGWQCIEKDCTAQIYTRSTAKDRIFWRKMTYNHNHPPDKVDDMLDTKLEYLESIGTETMNGEEEVITSGRQLYNYSIVRLTTGEIVMVYGEHKHRLLTTRTDGTKIYGCTISSCRAVIYVSADNEMKVYSGSCTAAEEASGRSFRRSHKVLSFEGHYYTFAGRRLENKHMVWQCYLRKSHNCSTLIYSNDENMIVASKHLVRVPHNHEPDAYKLEEGHLIVEGQKGSLPFESTEYHVGKNQAGTDIIIFEGLRYTILNTKVDGTKACRCLEDDTCAAYIYLSPNGTVMKFVGVNEHSHPLPEQMKNIDDFDFIIETKHVEKFAPVFKYYNGYEYRRQVRRENAIYYYRCSERKRGCMAAFSCNGDFSMVRENNEPHNHEMIQPESERRRTRLEQEGTLDYTMSVAGDDYEVLNYQGNQYCHFYYHKDGWRVWRCFTGTHCRTTLFQSLPDKRVVDLEKFRHTHYGYKKGRSREKKLENEETKKEEEKRCYSDSDSRESADWF